MIPKTAAQINGPQVGEALVTLSDETRRLHYQNYLGNQRIAELLDLIVSMEDYLDHGRICRGPSNMTDRRSCDCGLEELKAEIEKARGK